MNIYTGYEKTATKIRKGKWLYRGYIVKLKMSKPLSQLFGGSFTYWEIVCKDKVMNKSFSQLGEARIYIDKKLKKPLDK